MNGTSGQLHVTAALRREGTHVPIEQEAVWAVEPVWTFVENKKYHYYVFHVPCIHQMYKILKKTNKCT